MSSTLTPVEQETPTRRRSRGLRLLELRKGSRLDLLALALIVLLSSTATIGAMRHTSPTFDEITTMSGGARGFQTGGWNMMPDFPPLMQYLYGLPVYLSNPNYPVEMRRDTVPHRYVYARDFLYNVGNDPQRIVFMARIVAALCAALLIVLTWACARYYFGGGAALLAAGLVAFLPDVLAHGGVAYNDIAIAPAFLAALWSIDASLREPTRGRGIVAGLLISVALGIKHSALVLGPVAVLLIALELWARVQRGELRKTWKPIVITITCAVLAGYLSQALLYRGDFTLAYLRASTMAAQAHIEGGHGIAAYLLGRMTREAPWYFYPVAFLFKTSVALHILIVIAVAGAVKYLREWKWSQLPSAQVRALLLALVLFGAVLIKANLIIGFRYALPLLPIICILVAAGVLEFWRRTTRALRAVVVMLVVWSGASALIYYPHFLAYTSEYKADPDAGYSVFVDSSLDWGQGLLELRRFMQEEGVDRVYLSYFGSALPEAYGIKYAELPSFFQLNPQPKPETQPRFAAISATNLVGLYVGDTFAELRKQPPYRVLGHTMFIYKVRP